MGGNIDSRSCFDGGYLYVKTDKPYYYPGNQVLGKIYIRLERPMSPSHLEIKVAGKEKCSFMRTHGDDRHKEKSSRRFMTFRANCFTFNGDLMPGDYTIAFDFVLPPTIPASVMF